MHGQQNIKNKKKINDVLSSWCAVKCWIF